MKEHFKRYKMIYYTFILNDFTAKDSTKVIYKKRKNLWTTIVEQFILLLKEHCFC
jgi:hypothetical protein